MNSDDAFAGLMLGSITLVIGMYIGDILGYSSAQKDFCKSPTKFAWDALQVCEPVPVKD